MNEEPKPLMSPKPASAEPIAGNETQEQKVVAALAEAKAFEADLPLAVDRVTTIERANSGQNKKQLEEMLLRSRPKSREAVNESDVLAFIAYAHLLQRIRKDDERIEGGTE